jgi:ataxia telangiectasia mutated family protein
VYRQLAKSGNDDLRQDAVIQQFFGLVNTLLKQNTSTNSRSMRIRTYKVIPFSPEAGLLEWVDETVLLSNYLIRDKKGAHERYRPHDMKSRDISQMMRDAVTAEAQHKMYEEVCENFKPVMHNFFLEHYPDPSNWFERRVAYSRSCAVNSIVGYVIGLGDRHSSNIMIDKWTAEFIHIDFGVTFEQGLTLKTPERVPFRLTRDIVDGMGACGVEGIMRRCCEETMKVLRSNRDALTTIIAVLVHDPILKWAVGGRRQNANIFRTTTMFGTKYPIAYALNPDREVVPSDEGNLDAERALMRVKQKLDGYEDGELRSIEGQVQQLLHDARDPHKLAVMYAGWAPWV